MTKRAARGVLAGALATATIAVLVGAFVTLPSELTPMLIAAALSALVWVPVGVLIHKPPPRWRPKP